MGLEDQDDNLTIERRLADCCGCEPDLVGGDDVATKIRVDSGDHLDEVLVHPAFRLLDPPDTAETSAELRHPKHTLEGLRNELDLMAAPEA